MAWFLAIKGLIYGDRATTILDSTESSIQQMLHI